LKSWPQGQYFLFELIALVKGFANLHGHQFQWSKSRCFKAQRALEKKTAWRTLKNTGLFGRASSAAEHWCEQQ
jgi:hypothetical protein